MFTTAAQVAHAADSVNWFLDGGFGSGWDMDFDGALARAKQVTSLSAARDAVNAAFDRAVEVVTKASPETLAEPIPNDTIMDGAPRVG